jgi:CubicO group peptidase (beta-lactamase class C family)/Flp pilus assembly protein TadD
MSRALPPAPAQASGKYADKLKTFEEFVRRQMTIERVPGLTIGFIKDDFMWVKGFGYADLENKSPAKPESAYRLASVTKPMTALAVLQLAEKGKINLDAEVQTYVPYFPKKPWPVTVRQVLGHLGGISHYKNSAQELHIKERRTTREAVAIFENFDLVAEPGTLYSYSSYGYNLLGAIIESASGKSYGDYMRENVWLPLGMNDTRMDDPLEVIPNRVRGYQLVNGEVKNSEFIDISSRFAAGGTRSTVPDLLKFAKGVSAGKLLTKETYEAMWTSLATTKDQRFTDYGLGWQTYSINGHFTVSHSGGQQETSTLLYIFPKQNFAIAAAMNFENASPEPYVTRLFQLLTDEPWMMQAYTADKVDTLLYRGVFAAFIAGLAYSEKYQKPVTESPEELAAAFAYLNQALNPETARSDEAGTLAKIRFGRHPASKLAFTKVASYMAMKLGQQNGNSLDKYRGSGAIPFFNDYIELYRKDSSIPKEFRFNDSFEKLMAGWNQSWTKTNTAYVRRLSLSDANFDEVASHLKKSFTGAPVYPNLLDSILEIARGATVNGDGARATKSATLAAELYPEDDSAMAYLGIIQTLFGDKQQGQATLKRALARNAEGLASAGGLNGLAYQLAGAGKLSEGIKVLELALELHPKVANLYDSLGEFYMNKGEKQKAAEHYQKALDIDPNYPNAENARAMLKKLTS